MKGRQEKYIYRTNFENIQWRISSAWAIRKHDCNPIGIALRCGGICCKTPYYWPPSAYGGICGWLGENGCTLSPDAKPVGCHLYPLLLRKGLLQCHHLATMKKGPCRGNHNNGPMVIDTLADSLILLFGKDQFDRVREDVISGKNSFFNVPIDIARAFERELYLEDHNLPVEPRVSNKNGNT